MKKTFIMAALLVSPFYSHASVHHHFQHTRRVIQCVKYVQRATPIIIHANAKDWWARSDAIYHKSYTPKIGSILNLKPDSQMKLGHVAVVSHIINPREITVNHAHWASNGIRKNMHVFDISKKNDWSMLRFKTNGLTLGRVYHAYGFIHNEPPTIAELDSLREVASRSN